MTEVIFGVGVPTSAAPGDDPVGMAQEAVGPGSPTCTTTLSVIRWPAPPARPAVRARATRPARH